MCCITTKVNANKEWNEYKDFDPEQSKIKGKYQKKESPKQADYEQPERECWGWGEEACVMLLKSHEKSVPGGENEG